MSLGTGALNVGRGPEHFRPRQGGIHGNPVSENHPCKQLPSGTVTLNQISGKILTWPPHTHQEGLETSEREGKVGTEIGAPLQVDVRGSAWIRKDSLKQMLNDPLRSARIHKDSQKEQQLICKGSYKTRLAICNNQQNQTIRKHASKERRQRREALNPCDHPASCHMRFGVIRWPHKRQPATSIGSILTLPILYLATLNFSVSLWKTHFRLKMWKAG